ncbi:nematode resistance protein [Striga asiatica]|uniref:Nematode resistance protein n=1 Tax=Striga asiatica TaxID=4170 RepID=A0A5A7QNH9_STRAF|nr:nematode resistance protein [Striga asiatica]
MLPGASLLSLSMLECSAFGASVFLLLFGINQVQDDYNSLAEVWKLADDTVVVSHISEGSLLRLSDTSDAIVLLHPRPRLAGKSSIDYDAICKLAEIPNLRKCPTDDDSKHLENRRGYAWRISFWREYSTTSSRISNYNCVYNNGTDANTIR